MARGVPEWLAENLRSLREQRGLTQQQAARLAGVPRPTWATLESGAANPTLQVMLRAASALQVSVEALIAPPPSASRVHPAASFRARPRGDASVVALLPEPPPGARLERFHLPPGGTMTVPAHTAGWREWLLCESGSATVRTEAEAWSLRPGDLLVFRSEGRFSVSAGARERVTGLRLLAIAALEDGTFQP